MLLYAVMPADTHAVTMLLFEKIKRNIHNKSNKMPLSSSLLRCFNSMEPLFSGRRAAVVPVPLVPLWSLCRFLPELTRV